jgi:hypothetical protein
VSGGLHNVIVGYRAGSPKIALLWEEYGHRAVPHRACMACGRVAYFVQSGVDAIRSRDPEVICDECWERPDVKRDVYADL